jgi:linoleoyl-CoA desaturase
MGTGMAGIGLSIMHDAIHGAYSGKQSVNKFWGYTLNLVGGNAINWKIQHNIKHHTYTNVEDHDEDIAPKAGLRFSPNSKKLPMHKYQHIYGWFIYSLGSLFWVTFKDFVKTYTYYKEGILQKNTKNLAVELAILVFTKVLYFTYIIGLPIMLTSYTGLQITIGFLTLHIFSGLVLAVIFQPAHLMEEVEYPAPNDEGKFKYSWTVHQLYTTVNFGNSNRFLNWFAGGLNFQIEHHLFPNVCHVHYNKIAPIVKETAKEFNLPYYAKPTFFGALAAHTHQLKLLGTA